MFFYRLFNNNFALANKSIIYMEKGRNAIESILGVLGILSIIVFAYQIFKEIQARTETRIISEDALELLDNPDKAKLLRKAIDEYHRTGDWNKTELNNII